ncbi:MAG: hypothetical protein AAF564_07140 [Bacteroidota bacterium]
MKERTLFLVVPGVGSEEKGATVKNFASSYAVVSGNPILAGEDELVLPAGPVVDDAPVEDLQPRQNIEVFGVPILSSEDGNEESIFAELYWDDLSNVKQTLWGTIYGIFDIILSIRFLVPPLEKFGGAIWPARFSRVFFWLLRGPILALGLVAFLVWVLIDLVYIAREQIRKSGAGDAFFPESSLVDLIAAACAIAALSLIVLMVLGKQPLFRGYTAKVIILLLIFYAGVLMIQPAWGSINYTDSVALYGALFVAPVRVSWFVANLVVLLILVVILPLSMLWREHLVSQVACSLIPLISLMFWVALMPLVLVGMYLATPESMQVAVQQQILTRSVPTAGWIYLCLFFVAFVAGVVWAIRSYRVKKMLAAAQGAAYTKADPMRVVVSPYISVALYTAAVILTPMALLVLWNTEFKWPTYFQQFISSDLSATRIEMNAWLESTFLMRAVRNWTPAISGYVIVLGTFLIPLLNYNRDGIRRGLGILLDVINYFRPLPAQDFSQVLPAYDDITFSVRAQILHRFKQVTRYFTAQTGAPKADRLVLITHSQGTVLALDFLQNPAFNEALSGFKKVQLVTMGSPFCHIYGYYFPGIHNQCVAFDPEKEAGKPVTHWLNIYRTDDYIGTHVQIHSPIAAPSFIGWPKNVEVGPGAHTGYFRDTRVIPRIHAFVQEDRRG